MKYFFRSKFFSLCPGENKKRTFLHRNPVKILEHSKMRFIHTQTHTHLASILRKINARLMQINIPLCIRRQNKMTEEEILNINKKNNSYEKLFLRRQMKFLRKY